MFVTLETRSPCTGCGYLIRYLQCGNATVGKRSMRVRGSLGAAEHLSCPECGTAVPREMPLTPYRLLADDAARVAEYREKRWGVPVNEAAREGAG